MWHDVGEERCTQDFGGKTDGKGHLEDQAVDGRIILDRMNLKEIFSGRGVIWIDLVQDRDKWRIL
jgi:hypothetical protein